MSKQSEALQLADWLEEQYDPTGNQDRAADELRRLHAENEALREGVVTDDMRSAVRWAPSSAYWSERLREYFGPDARAGIDALERQIARCHETEALLRQALEALEEYQEKGAPFMSCDRVAEAIRKALN